MAMMLCDRFNINTVLLFEVRQYFYVRVARFNTIRVFARTTRDFERGGCATCGRISNRAVEEARGIQGRDTGSRHSPFSKCVSLPLRGRLKQHAAIAFVK